MLVTLASVGLAGFNVFLIAALRGADAGTVGAIIGCVPIGLALAGPLLRKERYRPRVLIAAMVVATGVFIVHGFGGAASLSSLTFALAAMLCEIGFSLLALHLLRDLGPVGLSTYASATGALILVLGGLFIHGVDDISLSMSHEELLAVVYLALVSTAGAFVMWYSSLERLPVEIAGLFAGVVPVAALLTAVLVDSATLNSVRVLGALVVGAGVVLGLTRIGE
jgi:drug/metabolite transporter (DMT)-like permease